MISLTWILGIASFLGIGGMIAVYFLFPALVPVIASALTKLIQKFLACSWCKIIAALLVVFFVGWWLGHHKAELECRAANVAAELRNAQIDRDNAVKAKTDESNRANQIETDANDQHTKDIQAIADLKKRPPTCAFDDTDAGGVPNDKSGTGNTQPPAGPDKADAGVPGSVPHKRLLLPMVRNSWLPWRGRKSDAAPHQ